MAGIRGDQTCNRTQQHRDTKVVTSWPSARAATPAP